MWSELVTHAVIGTARNEFRIPTAAGPLTSAFTQLTHAPAEQALLAAAALVTQMRRAGRKPTRPDALILAAAPETAPPCSSLAASHLASLLDATNDRRLTEWLDRATELGLRVPFESLPALLDAGKASRALRTRIVKVAGQRGRWLAAQNEDWRFAGGAPDDDALWQTGDAEARMILFETLRQSDPARARAFLMQTWRQESTDFKARVVQLVGHGLSAEDEPLLEGALDERRQDIRAAAAEVLAQLPGAAFRTRMLERVCAHLAVAAEALVVTLPDAFESGCQRDGIVENGPPAGGKIGPRAWWLMQMLRRAPARELRARLNVDGANWVTLARATEYGVPLLESIADAACLGRDDATLAALIDNADEMLEDDGLLVRVLEAAPPADAEMYIARQFRDSSLWFKPWSRPARILREAQWSCSPNLGRIALDALRAAVKANPLEAQHFSGVNMLLWSIAQRLPVSLAGEAATGWPRDGETWATWEWLVTDFLSRLQFRHDMLAALDTAAVEAAAIGPRSA